MKLHLEKGNILFADTNIIVNTINSGLAAGFGLDGQVRRSAGVSVEQQLSAHKRCEPGNVVITGAGKLGFEYIIHAVGPIWIGGKHAEEEVLRETYINCLLKAEEFGVRSIAFPNISTGIFNFPKKEAAKIALETIKSFESKKLERVTFFCFDQENFEIYKKIMEN